MNLEQTNIYIKRKRFAWFHIHLCYCRSCTQLGVIQLYDTIPSTIFVKCYELCGVWYNMEIRYQFCRNKNLLNALYLNLRKFTLLMKINFKAKSNYFLVKHSCHWSRTKNTYKRPKLFRNLISFNVSLFTNTGFFPRCY